MRSMCGLIYAKLQGAPLIVASDLAARSLGEQRISMQDTGRQDLHSPDATVEKSDATPVDEARGFRMWVGVGLIGLIFVGVILAVVFFR